MTYMAGSNRSWNGPTGHVDAEMLKTHIDDLAGPVYYIAGSPGMVAAMQKILTGAGARDVRVEQFAGY